MYNENKRQPSNRLAGRAGNIKQKEAADENTQKRGKRTRRQTLS